MKYANKSDAKYLLVIGDNEVESLKGNIRDLRNRDVQDVATSLTAEEIFEFFSSLVNNS